MLNIVCVKYFLFAVPSFVNELLDREREKENVDDKIVDEFFGASEQHSERWLKRSISVGPNSTF